MNIPPSSSATTNTATSTTTTSTSATSMTVTSVTSSSQTPTTSSAPLPPPSTIVTLDFSDLLALDDAAPTQPQQSAEPLSAEESNFLSAIQSIDLPTTSSITTGVTASTSAIAMPSTSAGASSTALMAALTQSSKKRPAAGVAINFPAAKRMIVVPSGAPFNLTTWVNGLSAQERANHLAILDGVFNDNTQENNVRLKCHSVKQAMEGKDATFANSQNNLLVSNRQLGLTRNIPLTDPLLQIMCEAYTVGGVTLLAGVPIHSKMNNFPVYVMKAALDIYQSSSIPNVDKRIDMTRREINKLIQQRIFAPYSMLIQTRELRAFLTRCGLV